MMKFRRSEWPSVGLPSSTLLPDWTTNAWVVGASTNDVFALSTLGEVVWTVGSTADALPPGMVRTY
jgi:hypothetical protein